MTPRGLGLACERAFVMAERLVRLHQPSLRTHSLWIGVRHACGMGNSCASGPSQGRRRLRPPAVPSLRGVLPAFQLKENVSSPPWLADSRAQVVATLACAIVPFRFEELVCVSCQGLCYESDAKQRCFAEARERTQRDGFLDEDFRGRAPDAARKVGRCVKAPLAGRGRRTAGAHGGAP